VLLRLCGAQPHFFHITESRHFCKFSCQIQRQDGDCVCLSSNTIKKNPPDTRARWIDNPSRMAPLREEKQGGLRPTGTISATSVAATAVQVLTPCPGANNAACGVLWGRNSSFRLKFAPCLVERFEVFVFEPNTRIHAVGEDGVFQGTGVQPGAAWQLVKKLLSHSFESGIDQVIDVRHSGAEIADIIHEIARIEVIGIREAEQVIGIEVSAVKQCRNKSVCVHRGKVME